MSIKERKIRNLEHEIKYYERVYKNCKKLDELRKMLEYYKSL